MVIPEDDDCDISEAPIPTEIGRVTCKDGLVAILLSNGKWKCEDPDSEKARHIEGMLQNECDPNEIGGIPTDPFTPAVKAAAKLLDATPTLPLYEPWRWSADYYREHGEKGEEG